jgi:hypothetical protein
MSARLAAVAIGRLTPGGTWVGLEPVGDEWRVVFGDAHGRPAASTTAPPRDLVLAAIGVYFEDALEDPPPELEATHEDIAAVVGWLVSSEPDPLRQRRLRESLDAVEDGLAVDEVIRRLLAAGAEHVNEPADWVDRLGEAYRSLSGLIR